MKEKEEKTEKKDIPNAGENALVPDTIMPGIDDAVSKEKMVEMAKDMMQKLYSDGDLEPFVIMRHGGDLRIAKLNVENGMYVLPEFVPPTKGELTQKKRIVNKILKNIEPILHRDIVAVTRIALLRKDMDRLKKMRQKTKTSEGRGRTRIANRVGCIFIETEDDSFQI